MLWFLLSLTAGTALFGAHRLWRECRHGVVEVMEGVKADRSERPLLFWSVITGWLIMYGIWLGAFAYLLRMALQQSPS